MGTGFGGVTDNGNGDDQIVDFHLGDGRLLMMEMELNQTIDDADGGGDGGYDERENDTIVDS